MSIRCFVRRRGVAFAAFALALVASSAAEAVNRFRIPNQTLPVSSTRNVIPVLADLDQDILGFSVSLEFDRSKLRIVEVRPGAAIVPLAPEFTNGVIDNTGGDLVYGVVFALSAARLDRRLTAGASREILQVVVDVVVAAESTTVVNLNDVGGNPGRRNVMTDGDGVSVSPAPTLVDGTITIASSAPRITDVQANSGRAGGLFFVIGQNFGLPGLRVRVCDAPATFTLLVDGQTLQVTAPACAVEGFAAVEVCNDFGCDSREQGFDYVDVPPGLPAIQDLQFNTGVAAQRFFIVGRNLDVPGVTVRVCGALAQFSALVDGQTLEVTAPACGAVGWSEVEVCNPAGCTSAAEGFFYEDGGPATQFIRGNANDDEGIDLSDGVAILNHLFIGVTAPAPCQDALDANDSGVVDLSDGVYVLNFLFLGGSAPAAPFPNPGTDPTDDSLPDC